MSLISLIALTEDAFFASLFEFSEDTKAFYYEFLLLCMTFPLLNTVLLAECCSSPSVLFSDPYALFDVLQG